MSSGVSNAEFDEIYAASLPVETFVQSYELSVIWEATRIHLAIVIMKLYKGNFLTIDRLCWQINRFVRKGPLYRVLEAFQYIDTVLPA